MNSFRNTRSPIATFICNKINEPTNKSKVNGTHGTHSSRWSLQTLKDFKFIRIKGLMGMASFTENKNQIRIEFNNLKKIFDELKIKYPESINSRFNETFKYWQERFSSIS